MYGVLLFLVVIIAGISYIKKHPKKGELIEV